MTHYVVGFLFTMDENSVVLIKKTKPDWMAGLLNGVGGKIEPGESPVEAMVREFREETGVSTEQYHWSEAAVMQFPGGSSNTVFFSFGDVDSVESTTEEEVQVHFVDEIPWLPVVPNLRWLVPYLLDFSRSRSEGLTVRYA